MTLYRVAFETDFSQTLKLKPSDFFDRTLSPGCRTKLRLAQSFNAVAGVVFEDITAHPWKILPCTFPSFGLGTTIILLTALYYLLSPSQKARNGRAVIRNGLTGPINYGLYLHFMEKSAAGAPYPVRVNTGRLCAYYNAQMRAQMLEAGYQLLAKLPQGALRRHAQKTMGRYLSKGQLVPVTAH